MDKNELEKNLDSYCGEIPLREPVDLWPKVRSAIKEPSRRKRPVRTLFAIGFSAAAVMVVLSIPGTSQMIKNGLKRMFSSVYSVQIDGGETFNGVLISANGEAKRIRTDNTMVEVIITKVPKNSAKIDLSIFKLVGNSPEIPFGKNQATFGFGEGTGAYKLNIEKGSGGYTYQGRFDPVESMPAETASVRGSLSPNSEETVIRDGKWLMEARVIERGGDAKAAVSCFKLYGHPKIVTLLGTESAISLADSSGKQLYKFVLTPSEKDLDSYAGSLVPVTPETRKK